MTSSRWRLILTTGFVALASVVITGALSAQRGDPQRGDPQRGNPQNGSQGGNAGLGVTIFADANFRGPNANFRNDVPDLRRFNMNDRVDSLQIGRGEVWEVCENINYKGRCQVFSGDEADLGRVNWGGMVSSMRLVRDTGRRDSGRGYSAPFTPGRPRLILFDDIGFRGQSFAVSNATPTLRALGNRARSASAWRCAITLSGEPSLVQIWLYASAERRGRVRRTSP